MLVGVRGVKRPNEYLQDWNPAEFQDKDDTEQQQNLQQSLWTTEPQVGQGYTVYSYCP